VVVWKLRSGRRDCPFGLRSLRSTRGVPSRGAVGRRTPGGSPLPRGRPTRSQHMSAA
jgi:hypothetical protein